jgi:hypothetical protein
MLCLPGRSASWRDELRFRICLPQLLVVQFAVLTHVVIKRRREVTRSLIREQVRHAVRQQFTKIVNAISQRGEGHTEEGVLPEAISRQRITKERVVAQFTLPFTSIVTGENGIVFPLLDK